MSMRMVLTFGNGGNLTDLPWYDHQFSDMRNAPPMQGRELYLILMI